MKSISLKISTSDYEAFKKAAKKQHRSVAQMIREAMDLYRQERLERRSVLSELPVVVGPKALESRLPSREEIYEELFTKKV